LGIFIEEMQRTLNIRRNRKDAWRIYASTCRRQINPVRKKGFSLKKTIISLLLAITLILSMR